MKRTYTRLAPAVFLAGLLATCEPWGAYDNPGDPESENYVGYPTVASSTEIDSVSAPDGGTLAGAEFTICRVEGATAYQLVIGDSEGALAAGATLENPTNSFVFGASTIVDGRTYYWKARARNGNGAWSAEWSPVASFMTRFRAAAAPTFDPSGGAYDMDQHVSISCATPDAVIHYTLDGTTPTAGSSVYSGSSLTVPVNPTTTLRAFALAPFFSASPIASATFSAKVYAVGDTGPAGGIVFYDKGNFTEGWRYLEAARSDQSTSIQWYPARYSPAGTIATGIGSGKANTAAIVAAQGAGTYAASLCNNLELGGYGDWFLPSKDELREMRAVINATGQTGTWWYWSSSLWEQTTDGAYCYQYSYTSQMVGVNTTDHYWRVRAVRSF